MRGSVAHRSVFCMALCLVMLGRAPDAGAVAALPIQWTTWATDSIVVADLNHDGNADIATAGGHDIHVSYGHGDGTFDPAIVVATPGNCYGATGSLAVGHVDFDQYPDLVWAIGDLNGCADALFVIRGNDSIRRSGTPRAGTTGRLPWRSLT